MGKVLFMRKGEIHTIPSAGILASEIAVGSSVYLMENGSPAEYLVVNQGIPSNSSLYDSSCDGTWLLRKDCSTKMQHDTDNSWFLYSDINGYLNATFFSMYDLDTQSIIKRVKIPYYDPVWASGIESGSNGSLCYVFLLSAYEVGCTSSHNAMIVEDGACLDYFTVTKLTDTKRIAYYDGIVTNWWLRSTVKNDPNYVWGMYTTGQITNLYFSQSHGVRPALILPHNALFDKNTLVLKGVS